MRYLSKYNSFLESSEEQRIINDILSTNESLINEGMIDKLKEYARKGVLTATILTSLMSNPTFAKEYKSLPSEEKQKIENSIKDRKVREEDGIFDISKSFKSGVWKLDEKGKQELNQKLENLVDYINSFKNPNISSFNLTIIARESTLRNYDAETKKPLAVKKIAELRAKEAKEYIKSFLKNYSMVPVNIVTNYDVEQGKDYENHQYVKIKIEPKLKDKKTTNTDFCNFNLEVSKENLDNNVALDTLFDVKDKLGSGYVKLKSGSIPDRVVIYGDNKLIGDSGYYSTVDNKYFGDKWKYTPANVLALTKLYRSNSIAISNTNLDIRKFDNFEDLLKEMSKTNSLHLASKAYKEDIDNAIAELKVLFQSGVREFVFHETKEVKVYFDLQGKYEKIQVIVYSSRGKSDFIISVVCNEQIQKKTP